MGHKCGEQIFTGAEEWYGISQDQDNYWRLLIDWKIVNQITSDLIQQRPVTPDFTAARKEIDAFVADARKNQGIEERALEYITDYRDERPGRIKQLKTKGAVEKTIAKAEVGEKTRLEIEHKANVLGSGMITAHGKAVARYSMAETRTKKGGA